MTNKNVKQSIWTIRINISKSSIKLFSSVLLFLILVISTFGFVVSPIFAAPGDLDTSFGDGGLITTDFSGPGNLDLARAVAIQDDNKIVVGGDSFGETSQDYTLVRYNPDGTLDQSFGNGGKVVTDITTYDRIFTIAIQDDGKILAGGQMRFTDSTDFAIARYNPNGTLDTTFGNSGIVFTIFPGQTGSANLSFLKIQSDGKIVATGSVWIGNDYSYNYAVAVARYNQDGSLDPTFGNSGTVTTDFSPNFYDLANSLDIQPDGKILVAGTKENSSLSSDWDSLIARYNSDGSLDAAFGTNGATTTNYFNGIDSIQSLQLAPDGKIVTVGTAATVNGLTNFSIARYNQDGSLDPTFGNSGKTTTNFDGIYGYATSSILQPDGKIVAGGFTGSSYSNSNFALIRYNVDGDLDTTFGNNGKIITDFTGYSDQVYGLALQLDSKIIAAGFTVFNFDTALNDYDYAFAVARYLSDNSTPLANAGVDQTVNEGQQITFDGSGSTDPDGVSDIVSYDWDFGDGNGASGQIANHTYADNGVYTATLTVTDSQNESDTDEAIITVNNVAPVVSEIDSPATVGTFVSFTANADFTDPGTVDTHTVLWDWGDGATSETGVHFYSTPGTYTITFTVTDDDDGIGSSETTINIVNQITTLDPAQVWIGLKNSDSVGMRFDLMAEALVNSQVIASGILDNVWGGSSGFNNANLYSIPFNLTSPVGFPPNSELSIKVYVRNACQGPTHNSGFARLWFDGVVANSRFGATIGQVQNDYYLRDNFALGTSVGSEPKDKIDLQAGSPCSDFKLFGTWSMTNN